MTITLTTFPTTLNLRGMPIAERLGKIEAAITPIAIPGAVLRTNSGGTDVLWNEPDGTSNGQWFGAPRFRFATSADAVMPLLEDRLDLRISRVIQMGVKKPVLWRVELSTDHVTGQAETLPLAACYALLYANGVTVLI